jgi:hypothetical protein
LEIKSFKTQNKIDYTGGPYWSMTSVFIRNQNADKQRKDNVKTWQDDDHLHIKERGFTRIEPSQHLELRLLERAQKHKEVNFHCMRHPTCDIFSWRL